MACTCKYCVCGCMPGQLGVGSVAATAAAFAHRASHANRPSLCTHCHRRSRCCRMRTGPTGCARWRTSLLCPAAREVSPPSCCSSVVRFAGACSKAGLGEGSAALPAALAAFAACAALRLNCAGLPAALTGCRGGQVDHRSQSGLHAGADGCQGGAARLVSHPQGCHLCRLLRMRQCMLPLSRLSRPPPRLLSRPVLHSVGEAPCPPAPAPAAPLACPAGRHL